MFQTGKFVSNITPQVASKIGANLHLVKGHPIRIVKERVYNFFKKYQPGRFPVFDELNPYVSVKDNFDDLLIPQDHPSRRMADTYYADTSTVLRTHTSAHQTTLLRSGCDSFLVSGPCFRRDSIDGSHYPVFHQMEGVRVFDEDALGEQTVAEHLQETLTAMTKHVFGTEVETRWVDEYFPFTDPSWELEVKFNGEWMEVLGCGVIQPRVLENSRLPGRSGWAFGQGLERLAMILFGIPDIRLFWSADERFFKQFVGVDPSAERLPRFIPFSAFPPTSRDVSFWLPAQYNAHDLYDLIRALGGDLVEDVKEIDHFDDTRSGRTAKCYRLVYRSMERTLETEEVNHIQNAIRVAIQDKLGGVLR